MSDLSLGGEVAPAATPAAEVTPTAQPGQEPVAPVTPEVTTDPFDDAKVETFDRKYVENLRAENAKHRTRASKFEQTFDGWPEEAVEGMLGLAKAIETGDTSAVPVLQNLLSQLSPEEAAAVVEAIASDVSTTTDATKFMTPEQVEEYIAEREQQKEADRQAAAADQKALDTLKVEIEGLGYNLNEPNPEASLLFHFANLQPGDGPKDFKAAHEAVEAMFQKRIDDYVGRVTGRNSKFARSAATTGLTPAGVDGGKKNLGLSNGGSRKAMEAFLNTVE